VDTFEFAQIPMVIILGFGITEILSSWGYQLRNRGRAPRSMLHFAASAWILLISVRFIWIQWGWRNIEWTYLDYIMGLAPALALALAAHVAKIDVATPAEHPVYAECRRPVCLLLAAWAILAPARGIIFSTVDAATAGVSPGAFALIFSVMIGTFAWLAFSRTITHHGYGWALLWAVQAYLTLQSFQAIGVN